MKQSRYFRIFFGSLLVACLYLSCSIPSYETAASSAALANPIEAIFRFDQGDSALTTQSTGTTTRVSVASDGSEAEYGIYIDGFFWPGTKVSADGRFIAFTSYSKNIDPNITENQLHVFVHDRISNATNLISVANENPGNAESYLTDISGDGRYVIFFSLASNLFEGDDEDSWDYFIYDQQQGSLSRLALPTWDPEDGSLCEPQQIVSVSDEAKRIAFVADCGPYNHGKLFVYDREAETSTFIVRVLHGYLYGVLSGNGEDIVFATDRGLVSEDKNGRDDVYVQNIDSKEIKLISHDSYGIAADGDSGFPAVSANGRYVLFQSRANNLVDNDNSDSEDVFLYDRQLGELTLISREVNGINLNVFDAHTWGQARAVSNDGRFVSFELDLPSLWPNRHTQVYVYDRQTDEFELISVDVSGEDTVEGQGNEDSFPIGISRDGRFVTFVSHASDLVHDDSNGSLDVFVRDRTNGSSGSHTISGQIRDSKNVPLFGATVSLHNGMSTSSDTNGQYEFKNLAAGTYVVTASIPHYEHAFPESWTVAVPPNQLNIDFEARDLLDSDGDALPDLWEMQGLDMDGDGDIEVDLPAMGADPFKKDIFVEIDWMEEEGIFAHSDKPNPKAIEKIVKAFADSPNGGINLHVDAGPDSIDYVTGRQWGELSRGNALPHREYMNKSEWIRIIDDHFGHSDQVFHYSLFIHKMDPMFEGDPEKRKKCQSGVGILQYSIVALGGWPNCSNPAPTTTDIATQGYITVNQEAGVFMHEFGHSLGLLHGGNQRLVNHKPNYLSVMNYSFTFSGLIIDGEDGIFDYSRQALPDLNETALNESSGLGTDSLREAGTKLYCPPGTPRNPFGVVDFPVVGNANEQIDWDCDFTIGSNPIRADINKSGSDDEILPGFDDWNNLVFTGQSIGPRSEEQQRTSSASAASIDLSNLPDELTEEDWLRLQQISDPRVRIQTKVEPETVGPLDVVTYSLSLMNIDASDAEDIALTFALPMGFGYVDGSTSGMSNDDPQVVGQELTWDLSDIPSSSAHLELRFSAVTSPLVGEFYSSVTGTSSNGIVHPTGETALVVIEEDMEANFVFLPMTRSDN